MTVLENTLARLGSRRGNLDERLTGPAPENCKHHRTLFLSDTHLGTPGCKAELLLDFLRHNEAETIYLVGDIVDGWRLKRSWYWTAAHNAVVQELLRKARKGANVIYVPGNHDEALLGLADRAGQVIEAAPQGAGNLDRLMEAAGGIAL